jgi:hypothetical protein
MYKLTLALFALLSLSLPTLAAPWTNGPNWPDTGDGLEKRYAQSVRVIYSHPAHDADLLARSRPRLMWAGEEICPKSHPIGTRHLFPPCSRC